MHQYKAPHTTLYNQTTKCRNP